MNTLKDNVQRIVDRVDRRKLRNNTQRVLLALLTANNDWVSRTSLKVPSASSRLRDLRKAKFGGFQVQCHTASELRKRARQGQRQTFYRINPRTLTLHRVMKVFSSALGGD